ncbi:MAG: sulfur carrier protein ThiS [Kiritimatiellia bacterium]|nr:sulfur carrier protein ThiS [Kiritimatiellia bacterium]
MKIIINGSEADVTPALTVSDLLIARQVKMPDMVSVELNGDILDRHTFQTTTLKEGDKVEFLYFMGGGTYLFLFHRTGETGI